MPERSTEFLIDTNLFVAAVKTIVQCGDLRFPGTKALNLFTAAFRIGPNSMKISLILAHPKSGSFNHAFAEDPRCFKSDRPPRRAAGGAFVKMETNQESNSVVLRERCEKRAMSPHPRRNPRQGFGGSISIRQEMVYI